jgi:hypothetical protein
LFKPASSQHKKQAKEMTSTWMTLTSLLHPCFSLTKDKEMACWMMGII